MSISHYWPKFEHAGKFTGEKQSASRWLKRIKLDLASSNSDFIPTDMYVWAIDALLEGPAAFWCDSIPAIKHILENYDTANEAEIRWLERELIKQFPGNIIDTPIDRIITRSRSYSLDVSADSGIVARRLGELYVNKRTKNWNQRPDTPQATPEHRKDRYHDGRDHRCEAPQKTIEGNVIGEYQFYNRPRSLPNYPKNHNDQYHCSLAFTKTPPVSNKMHSSDRAQVPAPPRGILKNSTSYHRKTIVHSYNSQERTESRYSSPRSPPHSKSNHNTNSYHRELQTQQPLQSTHTKYISATSGPSESRRVYRKPRTAFREVTVIPSRSQRQSWSYVPLSATKSTFCLSKTSTSHRYDSPPYVKRCEESSNTWKTSNSAIAELEHRLRASNSSSHRPMTSDRAMGKFGG